MKKLEKAEAKIQMKQDKKNIKESKNANKTNEK